MKELELISKTTPAVVSFNYAEIDAQLDITLKKYSGLVFTEETLKECKKTLSELKKGQKSLNDFKIKTKKLLTKDITKFEGQCRLLTTKFNTVITPISNQADQFEFDRRKNKNIEIKTFIENVGCELDDKYYEQLIVADQMLNKGTTMKSIKEDLTKQAELLKSQQTIETSNIEIIKSKVELAIATYCVPLLSSQYLDMMKYKEISEIVKIITDDAVALKKRNEEIELQKVIRAEKLEAEKLEAEERKANIVKQIAIKKAEREAKILEDKKIESFKAETKAKIVKEAPHIIEKAPIKTEMVQATAEEPEIYADVYKIEGTGKQLDNLENYLNVNSLKWTIEGEK